MKHLILDENDDEEPSAAFQEINDQSPGVVSSSEKSMM